VGSDPGEEDVKARRLPVWYWRWTWVSEAIRVVSILIIVPLLLIYLPAKGLVWGLDWVSDHVYRLRQAMYRVDLHRSGWTPPLPPRQRIELSDEWKDKLNENR